MGMTQPRETLILLDADGKVTDDRERAVGGEIVGTAPDGSVTSTLFTLRPEFGEGSADVPPRPGRSGPGSPL